MRVFLRDPSLCLREYLMDNETLFYDIFPFIIFYFFKGVSQKQTICGLWKDDKDDFLTRNVSNDFVSLFVS